MPSHCQPRLLHHRKKFDAQAASGSASVFDMYRVSIGSLPMDLRLKVPTSFAWHASPRVAFATLAQR